MPASTSSTQTAQTSKVVKLPLASKTEGEKRRSPNQKKYSEVGSREHLTIDEVVTHCEAWNCDRYDS